MITLGVQPETMPVRDGQGGWIVTFPNGIPGDNILNAKPVVHLRRGQEPEYTGNPGWKDKYVGLAERAVRGL